MEKAMVALLKKNYNLKRKEAKSIIQDVKKYC